MSLVLGKNPSNDLKEINLTSSGNLKVDLASSGGGALSANVDITGNSIGLATDITLNSRASEATLLNVDGSLTTIAGAVSGTEFQVDVVSSALPTGAATDIVLQSVDSYLSTIATDTFNLDTKTTQGYDSQIASGGNGLIQNLVYGRDNAGNLDALKTTANGNLEVEISGPLGSDVSANSVSVVIASDQSAISVSSAGGLTTNVAETLATLAGATATSTAVDMDGFSNLTIFGQTDNIADPVEVLISHDNSTYYTDPSSFVATQSVGSSNDFSIVISNSGARFYKIRQVDTVATAFTLVVNSSKK